MDVDRILPSAAWKRGRLAGGASDHLDESPPESDLTSLTVATNFRPSEGMRLLEVKLTVLSPILCLRFGNSILKAVGVVGKTYLGH